MSDPRRASTDECLLHDVLGARLIANEQQREPEKSRAVCPEQVADEVVSFSPLMVGDTGAW
ncbi:MAG TPA: hypothetical protein VHJ18_20870 [Streptosporangiaceae bacterium]|jgi:hypothetical protein|nr:hypothetical protein [Streptosporangiaceae bacterium]